MVPTTMLIWVMPPATTLGPASAVRRLTPAVQRGQIERQADAGAGAGVGEEGELQDAADGDRGGEQHAGARRADLAGEPEEDQGGDQHDVEQRLREGGGGEAVEPVQRAGEQRGERDQEEIGEGDPAEHGGEVELLRVAGEAGRQHEGQPGHADLGEDA